MLRKLEFIIRRVFLSIAVLLALSVVVFVLSRVVPSDPAAVYLGARGARDADKVAEANVKLGLDKPLYEQYFIYIEDVLHGDLGASIGTKRPVLDEIKTLLPATLELLIASTLLAMVVGIPLGVISAHFRGGPIDLIVRVVSLIGVSMPAFWLGLLLQLLIINEFEGVLSTGKRFDSTLRFTNPIEDITGFYIIDTIYTGNWIALEDVAKRLILPSVTLASYPIGLIARMTRASMLEVLEQDYIRTARAYGIRQRIIMYRYALRNAIIPVLTVIGLTFAYLLTGTFFVEEIFNWPGLGKFTLRAFLNVDYPAIMGVTLFAATGYVTINLIVDLLQAMIDPRINLE